MMMEAKVEITGSFQDSAGKIKKSFLNATKRVAIELQKMVQKTLRTQSNRQGTTPSAPGSPPHRGHSTLLQSIHHEHVRSTDTEVTYRVGSNLKYARIQERGGKITSQKKMTVPVSKEAQRHFHKGGNARNFPAPLVLIYKSPQIQYLVEKMKRKTKLHFLLTHSVKLPPRPYLRPTVNSAEFLEKTKKLFRAASNLQVDVS